MTDSDDYETRTTEVAVCRKCDGLWSETATRVRVQSEGAGEFIEIVQVHRTDCGTIGVNRDEWTLLRDAIDKMIGNCRDD